MIEYQSNGRVVEVEGDEGNGFSINYKNHTYPDRPRKVMALEWMLKSDNGVAQWLTELDTAPIPTTTTSVTHPTTATPAHLTDEQWETLKERNKGLTEEQLSMMF